MAIEWLVEGARSFDYNVWMTRTTIILPDLQVPYHSKPLFAKLLRVIDDLKPERLISVGDLIDFPQVSRWSKGTAEEYSGTLQSHLDQAYNSVLLPLREHAPEAEMIYVEGNHDARIRDYVTKYGPGLSSLSCLSLESLLGLDMLHISLHRGPVQVAPRTIVVHGHEAGGYAASPAAWALKFQRRYGTDTNVIFGHTHQGFLVSSATGYKGKVRPQWTMNVGSIMDPKHAGYVGDGAVNWVPSFAILRESGNKTFPELVLANGGSFMVEGKIY